MKIAPREIYNSLAQVKWKEHAAKLTQKVSTLAQGILLAGAFSAFLKTSPYVLGIGFFAGLAFPDQAVEKTARVWESFKQANIIEKTVMGAVAFAGLPVVTLQLASLLTGLRIGGYISQKTDMTQARNQWLRTA